MLTAGGAKLLDFGLAKFKPGASRPAGDADATVDGAIVGMVRYMAPEQLQGQETDGRSDLFSFGLILYEMLTGKRAFAGADAVCAPTALLDYEPVPASLLQSLAPLDHLVRRCLAKNPAERWQTATDVMHQLKWIAQTASQSRQSVPMRQESDQPAPGASERKDKGQEIGRFRRVTALIGALITTVAIAIWLSTQGARTSEEPPITFHIDAPDGTRFGLATMMPAPALAPDSRHLAFVAPFQSENSVWVQTLGSLDARHLTGTNQAAFPFWSPDGRFVAFGAAGRLKRISAAGAGAPQDLAATDGLFAGGVWSRTGTIIFSDRGGLFSRLVGRRREDISDAHR